MRLGPRHSSKKKGDTEGHKGQKAKRLEFFRVPETLDDTHAPDRKSVGRERVLRLV